MNRSEGPLGMLVHGVTSGIGFATEVYGYKKSKKAAKKEREQKEREISPSPSDSSREEKNGFPNEKTTEADYAAHDEVERSWQLDEAQDTLVESKPHKSKSGVANPDKVIGAFLQRQPPPYSSSADGIPIHRLTYPIAIPQRRPKDKKRGFIRAYAPDLQNMGINQDMWFDFIETLNEASLANPWINAINLASIAFSPLPTVISQSISMAIMVATTVAIEAQSRYRQNKALDKLNKEFFNPRGLFCLVMTWDPTSVNARTNVNVHTTIQNTIDGQGKMKHKFQSSNGITNGMENMQTAQLVFPGLDLLASATDNEQKGFKEKMKRGKLFVDDYMDRKAQAKFIAENPNSHLNQAGKPKFVSKYADPTHPMHSGLSNIMGRQQQNGGSGGGTSSGRRDGMERGMGGRGGGGPLGLVNMAIQAVGDHGQNRSTPPAPYGSNSEHYDEHKGQQQYQYQQPYQQGSAGAGAGGLSLGNLFRSKVLYLMVVNMPTDDEMAQAQRLTADWNIQGHQQEF
ncbi:hypothetical protein ASPWEDRAFT_103026 [Aspergillus wentii DTO 134E9]|uniref:Uncharacterized protein n=1 Tax=Aspergillus wentii DTO 134E9 TaxID=1073089 RepID=A0A1L9RV75_ASPWE|nr:uncharacterized protein ASPWEDRAFT_103026 [Aspergillus wentii DTO 134E9]KAI9928694.1 hypothetical protein MW887_001911 [Aspergillus wentii]OJJ38783.1 hypothetical protein ASPWEDRAFT_103026 [Aspergillus wentii DTO 134E9]